MRAGPRSSAASILAPLGTDARGARAARFAGSVALAVAFIAAAARFAVPVPGTPVPVTLQDLAVLLVGFALGPRLGASALFAYLGVGALGAPVFSSGHAGLAWLAGPTGGYLLAYPLAAWIVGHASAASGRLRLLGGVLVAQAVVFTGGVLQLGLLTGEAFGSLLTWAVTPFLPGVVLKTALLLAIAEAWRRGRGAARRGGADDGVVAAHLDR